MSSPWVEFLNRFGSSTFEFLVRASWQGAIAIALVWILCKVWSRMPSSLRCSLWLLACLRLFVGLSPSSISVPVLPPGARTINEPLPLNRDVQSLTQFAGKSLTREPKKEQPPTRSQEAVSLVAVVAILWSGGSGFVGGFAIRQMARSLRFARQATLCTDRLITDQVAQVTRLAGIKTAPKIVVSHNSPGTLTIGVVHPIVMLSSKALATCSTDEFRMVLAHEFAHIRRRDSLFGLIPQIAQVVFFFHPLVWLACREFDLAREAACDEAAITGLGIRSDHYGRLLLKLGTCQRAGTTFCTPGVSSHFHLLRRRIAMLEKVIDHTSRSIRRRSIALVCLASALCIAPLSLVQGQSSTLAAVNSPHKLLSNPRSHASLKRKSSSIVTSHEHTPKSAITQTDTNKKPILKVFHLRFANAEKAANILHQVLSMGNENTGRVAADAATNSLIVSADESMSAQIANVIDNLDQISHVEAKPTPTEPSHIVVFSLKYVSAEEALRVLQTLFESSGADPVKIVGDHRTNAIIITASTQRAQEIQKVLMHIDLPAQPDGIEKQVTRVINLTYAKALPMCTTVSALLNRQQGEVISPDPVSNALVARGSQARVDEITKVITALDRAQK